MSQPIVVRAAARMGPGRMSLLAAAIYLACLLLGIALADLTGRAALWPTGTGSGGSSEALDQR